VVSLLYRLNRETFILFFFVMNSKRIYFIFIKKNKKNKAKSINTYMYAVLHGDLKMK